MRVCADVSSEFPAIAGSRDRTRPLPPLKRCSFFVLKIALMPYLCELTAVPAGWPLDTVLDAFVHSAWYGPWWDPGNAQRALEALAARLVELWAARPAEAAAWRGLSEDRSQERLAELLFQHARSERSRCVVGSFSEAGLERVAWSWTPLAAAEAEAEETARKRQKVEERGQEEQLREEKRQLGERLEAAEAELHSAKEVVAQVKLQNAQLSAGLDAAQAASTETQREIQAAKHECGLLADRLAAVEATAAHQARELQAAQDEGVAQKEWCEQLARRLEASEAEASRQQRDLQRLQDECAQHKENCDRLATCLAAVEAVSGNKPDLQSLLESSAVYKDRCEQLNTQLTKAEAKLETKLGQMQALWQEKGACQERCRQLERQLTRFGGHGAHAALACGASSSPESGLTEQMGYTMVDVDDDASSVLSCSSWFSVRPHCFMSDAIFKTRSCGNDFFLPGGDLKKGSQVVAGDDATILKVVANPELCRASEVVDLQAGAATLRVTPDHLVQVPVPDATGESGKIAENRDYDFLAAGDLKVGDHVMLDSGEPVVLASVDRRPADCEVLKIVFEPDLPVAVFSSPPCILSKGHKRKPSTRRGKDKNRGRSQGTADQPDGTMDGGASIPMTAGDYMD